jgi:phospholipid transport system substrate-binding protein
MVTSVNINQGSTMIKRMAILSGALLLFLAAGTVPAQSTNAPAVKPPAVADAPAKTPSAPDALVKSTVDEVLDVIKITKDRRALNEVVEKKVLPHFDFQAMTRLAVGRYWREASPAQQKSLENAFRSLLVNTYATALSQSAAPDQSVDVRPAPVKPADDDVTVKTLVKESGRKPIAIDYRMAKASSGWKVYDVVVENLSLVTNYRGTFNSEIGRSGIDGLIKSLEAKNKSNAEG